MLWKRKRKWHQFDAGLLAVNAASADFLKDWYRLKLLSGEVSGCFEVLDILAYEKITAPSKVFDVMSSTVPRSFVLFAGLN